MKMIRLFIVTITIVLSGASMPSLGGLPKKTQDLKADGVDKECSQLFENLSLDKVIAGSAVPDKTDVEYCQRPKPDSISENGDEFHDDQVDTEVLGKELFVITAGSKEVDALKNSTMATNYGAKCNVLRGGYMGKKLLRNSISYPYTVDNSLRVDHETAKYREGHTSRLVEPVGYHCNEDNYFLSFSKDSRYLLSSGKDKAIMIWANKDGKWSEEITISNDDAVLSACFSHDSRHMVVNFNVCGAIIYSLGTDNKWGNISTSYSCMRAALSPNSRHIVIYNNRFIQTMTVREDRVLENARVSNHDNACMFYDKYDDNIIVTSAYFTINNSYLIITCHNKPNIVLRLESKHWKQLYSIPADGKDTLLVATIGNDDLYMVATDRTGSATIFRLGTDGKWMGKAMFPAKVIYAVGASVDGIHIVTKDYHSYVKSLAKIWSLGANGVFEGKDILRDKKDVVNAEDIGDSSNLDRKIDQAKFSNDGRHMAILSDDRIILCSQNEGGGWLDEVIIEEERSIQSFTFSTDSTHMIITSLIDCNGKTTFTIWKLGENGELEEKNIFSSNDGGINSIAFSEDGSNMVMACANGNVKIWGEEGQGEQWRGKKDCVTGSHMVIFSPDSRYVASIGDGHVTTVFALDEVNLPSLPTPD
ncbi:MAG: WD40 repeat domain-containing protein [Candidatus Endonucleobacter bathymodioli]|uniref:WD40 repeat domain-containing protein n=1 Tax=Candidatus Endonucleibacter bathymodioli TaxID=539814 RepID=A0AA90NN75_9GAMM|nr:WD40 repeat domain-containing protein [Candidatus Endonucleobacter bathymodioli]